MGRASSPALHVRTLRRHSKYRHVESPVITSAFAKSAMVLRKEHEHSGASIAIKTGSVMVYPGWRVQVWVPTGVLWVDRRGNTQLKHSGERQDGPHTTFMNPRISQLYPIVFFTLTALRCQFCCKRGVVPMPASRAYQGPRGGEVVLYALVCS